ncbi:MAG: hypothetical protein NT175_00065, partial [Bacteroidetes bacterium]|nr:hypothetical protein [Bacteroidota bacterium]
MKPPVHSGRTNDRYSNRNISVRNDELNSHNSIYPLPDCGITLGPNPTVCSGTTIADLPYSAPIGNPDHYSITWDATALGQGFTNVWNADLGPSPIVLSVPAGATPGTYNGTLIVSTPASCVSDPPYPISVTINPTPSITDMTAAVCSGATFTVTPVNVTNGIVPAGTTYSWPAPTVTGGMTGGSAGSGASNISGTLTNPTNTAQTATYTVTPTSGTCVGAT